MCPKLKRLMEFIADRRIAIALLYEAGLLTTAEGTRLAQELNRRQSAIILADAHCLHGYPGEKLGAMIRRAI